MLILRPCIYERVLRPLLFLLPPEVAQSTADFILKRKLIWNILEPKLRILDSRLKTSLGGINLQNPIGLAAGYDKNCSLLPSLASLGFGYVIGGTVTESPRPGNAKPRVIRDIKAGALVNSLGFPSYGLDVVANNLLTNANTPNQTPVIVSISGINTQEILNCHNRLEAIVKAIEINISSPNTKGLKVFQSPTALMDLLNQVNEKRKKPLFVKLPPYDFDAEQEGQKKENVLELARVCKDLGIEGLTIANTWPVTDKRLASGTGGLSGKPIFSRTLKMVTEVRSEVGLNVAINACGGISTGEDVWNALLAGATTVQLLTSLIYRGPGLIKQMIEELSSLFDADSYQTR